MTLSSEPLKSLSLQAFPTTSGFTITHHLQVPAHLHLTRPSLSGLWSTARLFLSQSSDGASEHICSRSVPLRTHHAQEHTRFQYPAYCGLPPPYEPSSLLSVPATVTSAFVLVHVNLTSAGVILEKGPQLRKCSRKWTCRHFSD